MLRINEILSRKIRSSAPHAGNFAPTKRVNRFQGHIAFLTGIAYRGKFSYKVCLDGLTSKSGSCNHLKIQRWFRT